MVERDIAGLAPADAAILNRAYKFMTQLATAHLCALESPQVFEDLTQLARKL